MSTLFQPLYGANVAFTWTSLASLAISNGTTTGLATCAAVDNTVGKFQDAHIYGHAKSGATPPAAGLLYSLYLYWSNDNGTTYTLGTGGDGAINWPDSTTDLTVGMLKVIGTSTANNVYNFNGFSFCQAAGLLFLPSKWGVAFGNVTTASATLNASGSAFSYQGVNWQGN
jgi:hypothetical protein